MQRRRFLSTIYKFHRLDMGCYIEGLSQGEFAMLSAINLSHGTDSGVDGEENINVSSLAEDLHVSAPAVSRMLTSLEKKGCIERIISKHNRRVTYVKITDFGKKTYTDAEKALDKFIDDTIDNMGRDNFEQLLELLNKLYDATESASKNI